MVFFYVFHTHDETAASYVALNYHINIYLRRGRSSENYMSGIPLLHKDVVAGRS